MKHAFRSTLPILLLFGCTSSGLPPGPERETPVTQHTEGRGGRDLDPELSPDGRHLFYASTSYSELSDLYVKRIGSNTAVRLTSLPGNERFPKVNPARPRTLAFCSDASGGEWQIYVMKDYVDHPKQVMIVSEEGTQNIHPSWSPDGTKLVYCSSLEMASGNWVLKILDLRSGQTRVLEGIDGLLPEWSPRSNRIVFQRMRHRDNWFGTLWTLEYVDGNVQNLMAVFSSDDWAAINPSWSPDGRKIVFATVAKSRDRRQVQDEADDLWTLNADGSRPMRLTTHPDADWMPTWSPDGTIYFVSKRSGTNRIWSLATEPGRAPKRPELPGTRPIVRPTEAGR